MPKDQDRNQWQEEKVALQEVVLSNSWALQAILQYLEELNPGARDRIWQHYILMRDAADEAMKKGQSPEKNEIDEDHLFEDEE